MAKQTKEPTQESFITPLIRFGDEKHLLEQIMETDKKNIPTMKSVGYMSLKEGSSSWVSYVITTRGKEVLNIEISEPDLRAIAEESAKISFVEQFIDQDSL